MQLHNADAQNVADINSDCTPTLRLAEKSLARTLYITICRIKATWIRHYVGPELWDGDPDATVLEALWEIRDHVLSIDSIFQKNKVYLARGYVMSMLRFFAPSDNISPAALRLWSHKMAYGPKLATGDDQDVLLSIWQNGSQWFSDIVDCCKASSAIAPKPVKGKSNWDTFLEDTILAISKHKRDRHNYMLPDKEVAELVYGDSSAKFLTRVRRARSRRAAKPTA